MATVIITSTSLNVVSTLNLFLGTRVSINTETLGVAWQQNKQYRFELTEGFVKETGKNISPNPANANFFTITTNSAPTIATTTPVDNTTAATGIVNARLTITFNRKIKLGSGNVQVYQSGSPDVLLLNVPTSDPLISLVDTELRITVTGLMRASTSYYVRVDNGAITDRDGFAFTGINNTTTFNFTTAASTNVLFRDLSANITGAFSPTMTAQRTRPGQIVMASSFASTTTIQRNRLGASNMSSTFTILAESTEIFRVFASMTSTILRIRPGVSSVNSVFVTDRITAPFVDQTNGYTFNINFGNFNDNTSYSSLADYPAHSRVSTFVNGFVDFGNFYVNSSRTAAIGGSQDTGGEVVIFAQPSSGVWSKTQTIPRTAVGLTGSFSQAKFGSAVAGGVTMDDSATYAAAGSYHIPTATHKIHTFSKSGGVWDLNQNITSNVNLYSICMSGNGLVMAAVTSEYLNIYTRVGNTWTLSKQYPNLGFYNVSVSSNGNVLALGSSFNTQVYTKSGADWTITATVSTPQRISGPNNAITTVVDGVGPIAINRAGNRIIRNSERFIYVYDLIAGSGWTEVSRVRYSSSFLGQFSEANQRDKTNDFAFFNTQGNTGFTSIDNIVHQTSNYFGTNVILTPIS